MIPRATAAVVMVLLLAGCTAAPIESLAPAPAPVTATPTPQATPAFDVPIQGTGLKPAVVVVAPVRIQIPSVQVDIPVEPVGVQETGEMVIPSDIRTAGWYMYGSGPESATGSTVITAHVDSFDQGLGPFAYLKEMPDGAEVIVTTADGVDHNYVVTSVDKYNKKEIPLADVFDRKGAPRLVLVTCGGQFDESVRNYTDNIIALANPA